MSSEITVYESADFGSLRMFEEDGEVYAVASDLAHCLGYRDAEKMTRSLDEDERDTHIVGTPGGPQEMTVVTEAGIYHAILMRRSACVRDPSARERVESFQRWVTHEVLPSIRKTGAYLNPKWSGPGDEEGMALLSQAVVFAQHKLAELHAENEAMRPMAALGEAMLGSEDTILVRELAQLLTQAGFSIGGGDLFKLLRDDGYLIKANSRDHNAPTRRSIEMGLFEVRETVIEYGGSRHVKRTPRVTPRGQAYFLDRYAGARKIAGLEVAE